MEEAREREGEQGREKTGVAQIMDGAESSPTKTRLGSGRSRAANTDGNGHTPSRPVLRKLRRRSTLEWANATPQRRQETLENVAAERMADVFFSLHVRGFEGW